MRSSDPVASLFQSDGKGAAGHFKPGDANYMIGDFIGVVGARPYQRKKIEFTVVCWLSYAHQLGVSRNRRRRFWAGEVA